MSKQRYPFKKIFLHNSDSEFGTALMINGWHKERGWKEIGYHEVIQNGFPNNDWFENNKMIKYLEGAVEIGRQINSDEWFTYEEMGAQVKSHNHGSYGICMIGKNIFSNKVLNSALRIVRYRCDQFNMGYEFGEILGHYEADSKKTCPNIDMYEFRSKLKNKKEYGSRTIIIPEKRKSKKSILNIILKFLKTIIKGDNNE